MTADTISDYVKSLIEDEARYKESQRIHNLLLRSMDTNRTIPACICSDSRTNPFRYGSVAIRVDADSWIQSYYIINIPPEKQDVSQKTRAIRENSDANNVRVTTQSKEWFIEKKLDTENNPFLCIEIEPVNIWSFLRDKSFLREPSYTIKDGKSLSINEADTLNSVKSFHKLHPNGSHKHASEILSVNGLLNRDTEKFSLTPKGLEYLEEYKRFRG